MAPDDQLDRLRERIATSDIISDADREVLQAFDDALTLLNSEYSTHRHLKLLRHCAIVAEEVGNLANALDERRAAETIVRWIHRTYDNEETNRDYRVALRVFGRRTSDEMARSRPIVSSGSPVGPPPPTTRHRIRPTSSSGTTMSSR